MYLNRAQAIGAFLILEGIPLDLKLPFNRSTSLADLQLPEFAAQEQRGHSNPQMPKHLFQRAKLVFHKDHSVHAAMLLR